MTLFKKSRDCVWNRFLLLSVIFVSGSMKFISTSVHAFMWLSLCVCVCVEYKHMLQLWPTNHCRQLTSENESIGNANLRVGAGFATTQFRHAVFEPNRATSKVESVHGKRKCVLDISVHLPHTYIYIYDTSSHSSFVHRGFVTWFSSLRQHGMWAQKKNNEDKT